MSKYTTEVRFICETGAGLTESKGFNSISDIIETAAPKVFNFDFPMFDEAYRLPLEIKILRHYYTREICEETVGLWKLRLQDRLNMIMPYYNQLYKSELIEFNPLYDVDVTRDHKRDNEGESNSTGTGETTTTGNGSRNRTQVVDTDTKTVVDTDTKTVVDTDTTNKNTSNGTASGTIDTTMSGKSHEDDARWDLYSDTPQGGIDVITNDSDSVIHNTYLTNARRITDTKDGTTSEIGKETSSNTNTVTDNGSGTVDTTETGKVDTTQTGEIDTTVTDNESATNTGTSNTTTSGKNTMTSTEDYLEHVKGKQGGLTYSKMLAEFRETFLNIDKMIINDLSDLFFGLW